MSDAKQGCITTMVPLIVKLAPLYMTSVVWAYYFGNRTLCLSLASLGLLIPLMFGTYAIGMIGYRVLTFNDCRAARRELEMDIERAKEDLTRKGVQLDDQQSVPADDKRKGGAKRD